jgi:hypothetical protein
MIKRLIIAFSSLGLLLAPVLVYAHNQPGPPYLMVEGIYADTNPVTGISPGQIAQDQIKQSFVVGRPISFAIDESRIGVASQFRWKWTPDMAGYEDGSKLTHSYDKPGSYIVTLQADNQFTGNQFADYDTVQIDVVPRAGYQLPAVQVYVQYQAQSDGYLARLSAYDSHDPSADTREYHWLYGDGTEGSGAATTHLYSNGSVRLFPAVFIRDSNNLLGYAVFEIDQENNTFKPVELAFLPGALLAKPPAFRLTQTELAGGAVVVIFVGTLLAPQRRTKRKKI